MSRQHEVDERQAGARVVFSLLALGLGTFEAFHDLVRRAAGDGPSSTGALHVALLLVAAAAVWVRRDAAWLAVLAGVASCVVHGVATSQEGSPWGPALLAAAPVLLLLGWQGRSAHPVWLLAGARHGLRRVVQTVTRGPSGPPR